MQNLKQLVKNIVLILHLLKLMVCRKLNTSAVTDMNDAFKDCSNFNEDITRWNTVTTMSMFYGAESF